jgi:hypothetical protein
MVDTEVIHLTCDMVATDNVNLTSGTVGIDRTWYLLETSRASVS